MDPATLIGQMVSNRNQPALTASLPPRAGIIGQVAQKVVAGVKSAAGAIEGALPGASTLDNDSPEADAMRGHSFAANFQKVPDSVTPILPTIGNAARKYNVPTDSLYYTLISENAPADPNPAKPIDPNDQGMFQINKMQNGALVKGALKNDYGMDYDPTDPHHSAIGAAVVLSHTRKILEDNGITDFSPKDLSVAYRMGATNYSIAKRGTDLNGNKQPPHVIAEAKTEYAKRVAELGRNSELLSTTASAE